MIENIKRLEKTIAEKLDDEAWNDLQELYKYIQKLEHSNKYNVVSKSKIREKIEELEKENRVECIEFNQDVIRILQELLEERRIKVWNFKNG